MKNCFTLKEYSLLATSVFIQTDYIFSQVVYFDIEPDYVIDYDYESLQIDMDNNGFNDFELVKTSGTATTSYSDTYFLYKQWIKPYYTENSIAAKIVTHGFGGSTWYWPYKLDFNDLIDDELHFYNWWWQSIARMFIKDGIGHIGVGYFAHDTTDGYIGVRFIDEEACYHYGWIRLAVVDSCRKMIVKDYAYEEKCDYPIIAGDTMGYVGVEVPDREAPFVYGFGSDVYIRVEAANAAGYFVEIYTPAGKIIHSRQLVSGYTKIAAGFPPGMYVVVVKNEDSLFTKKILLY